MDDDEFIFLDEFNKGEVYDKLYPESTEGRIVLWLYNKIEIAKEFKNEFAQSELDKAIKSVKIINVRDTHGITVNKLYKHFLYYNPVTEKYNLKDHAIRFGQLAYKTLETHSKPSRIQKICTMLRRDLERYIVDNNFAYWKEFNLDKNKHEFLQQIEVLDEKLNILIIELRNKKSVDIDFLDFLQSIIAKLDLIENEYEKLETAFAETNTIKTLLLNEIQKEGYEREITNQIQESIDFFNEIRRSLAGVSYRINKIQPIIKQQISIFSRAGFVSRINKFIEYLIDKSDIRNQKVSLPNGINRFQLNTQQPTFITLQPWTDPPPINPRSENKVTASERQKAFSKDLQRLDLQKEARNLVEQFNQELLIKEEMLVSPYFSKILNEDWGNFGLAIKFSYLIMRKYNIDKNWKLEVLPKQIMLKTKKSRIELWEMKVCKRN